MVDEHLNWKDHINIIENKLSKNLGLLHKAKQFLNTKAIKSLYFECAKLRALCALVH